MSDWIVLELERGMVLGSRIVVDLREYDVRLVWLVVGVLVISLVLSLKNGRVM